MTKNEYLSNLRKKSDKAESFVSPKGKRRRAIIAIILIIGTAVSIGIGIKGTESGKETIYDAYIADHSEINYEYLNYRNIFELWNNGDLGNDVNVLLSGGKTYNRAGIAVYPDETGEYCIFQDSTPIKALGYSISYINVTDNTVFYREDETRNLVSYQIDSDQLRVLVRGNVGEVFVSENRVYYIDLKNGILVSINPSGREKRTIYEYPINSFAVCGSNLFVLDNNKRFGIYHINEDGTGYFSTIASNIERFFIGGNIIAESGNTVFTFTPNGGKAESVYESDDSSMRLVGISGTVVFVQESGKLYALVEGSKVPVVNKSHVLYQSVLSIDDKAYLVIATTDSQNALASSELLTFNVK